MARSRLRVYYGPESAPATVHHEHDPAKVTVPLGDVLPLLVDAVRHQRAWLGDFMQDDVTISTDLYEVLLAYRHYRRPSA